jgi:hypothetical protein
MRRFLLVVSVLTSVATAAAEYPHGTPLTMSDLPEWQSLWHGFSIVDHLEIPEPVVVMGNDGPVHVIKAEESAGGGTRLLKDEVYMTQEGADKALQMIRASLQEWDRLQTTRQQDMCARKAIPTTSVSEFAAYLEGEKRFSETRQRELVDAFLAALSPADALAYRQWATSGKNFSFATAAEDYNEVFSAWQVADVEKAAARLCESAASNTRN